MDAITFTEEQAINITMEHGYDGSEFNTARWKSNGCLKGDGTQEKLIKNLETIFQSVKVEGKGKKRRYILSNKFKIVKERSYNYKGSVPTLEDKVMKEYIFKQLLGLTTNHVERPAYTYGVWGTLMGMLDTKTFDVDVLSDLVRETYSNKNLLYNPKEITSKFIQSVSKRNQDVIKLAFNHLQDEGRIRIIPAFLFKNLKGKIEEMTEYLYNVINKEIKSLVENEGMEYKIYILNVNGYYKNPETIRIEKIVNRFMLDKHNLQYTYKAYKVELIDTESSVEVSEDDFMKAYTYKYTTLLINRVANRDTEKEYSFWQKFEDISNLTLLKSLTDVDEDTYLSVIESLTNRI